MCMCALLSDSSCPRRRKCPRENAPEKVEKIIEDGMEEGKERGKGGGREEEGKIRGKETLRTLPSARRALSFGSSPRVRRIRAVPRA
jgi:hypothetical protein